MAAIPLPVERIVKHLYTLLLAILVGCASSTASSAETDIAATVQALQDEWAVIFYQLPESLHAEKFKALLARAHAVSEQYPTRAEPLILEGIVLCTYAGADVGLGSLRKVKEARQLFEKSIDLDPRALDASAYIALGNLYYRLPGWPISYGDNDLARQYFEIALKLYPDAIDTNYFYGEFLLDQGEFERAEQLLVKADAAPVRSDMQLSDLKLKEEIRAALAAARRRNTDRADFFSQFRPSFTTEGETP